MTVAQVKKFYIDKENAKCPLTNRLVTSGYQQTSGGYITYAKECGIEINNKKASPSQWWHLIKSYCDRTKDDVTFTKQIQCGELIFWMAEVSGAASREELSNLVDRILSSKKMTMIHLTEKNGI